jgi:hypothetical protein
MSPATQSRWRGGRQMTGWAELPFPQRLIAEKAINLDEKILGLICATF